MQISDIKHKKNRIRPDKKPDFTIIIFREIGLNFAFQTH